MRRRCLNACGNMPSYAAVELRVTLDEWIAWSVPRYARFIARWPNKIPHASRHNDEGHYEIGNISIVSQQTNRAIQAKKKAAHPDGKKTCSNCRKAKPLKDFGIRSSALDGLQSRCKCCINGRP